MYVDFSEDSLVLGIPTRGFCYCSVFQSACIPEAVVYRFGCVLFTWWKAPACIHCLLQHLERPKPCVFMNEHSGPFLLAIYLLGMTGNSSSGGESSSTAS